ncbi:hypothetical protein MK079_05540, partial [Candidatus Gracilibacteria bacterium]|nr:hypothetical protein [Candidatus Gracilibacteria bacterium]
MKYTALTVAALLLTLGLTGYVSADDHEDSDSNPRSEFRTQIKQHKMDRNETVSENRQQIRENKKQFRDENKQARNEIFENLDEDTQNKLQTLKDETKQAIKVLRDTIKDAEDRQEVRAEIQALYDAHTEKVKTLLADYPEALELVEKAEELREQNMQLRAENKQAREEFRGERSELVSKYKKNFVERIGNRLDTLSDEKLEKVLSRIETLIEKYESNENISDERKDSAVSQLIALQEMIEEK